MSNELLTAIICQRDRIAKMLRAGLNVNAEKRYLNLLILKVR